MPLKPVFTEHLSKVRHVVGHLHPAGDFIMALWTGSGSTIVLDMCTQAMQVQYSKALPMALHQGAGGPSG